MDFYGLEQKMMLLKVERKKILWTGRQKKNKHGWMSCVECGGSYVHQATTSQN